MKQFKKINILLMLCLVLIFAMSVSALPPNYSHPWGGDDYPWGGDNQVALTIAGDDDPFNINQPATTIASDDEPFGTDQTATVLSTDPWNDFKNWFKSLFVTTP